MKFHRNVPAMVLCRIFKKNLIPSKTLVAMAHKFNMALYSEIFRNLVTKHLNHGY